MDGIQKGTHKHKGVVTAEGKLRSHPIDRIHTYKRIRDWHNFEVSLVKDHDCSCKDGMCKIPNLKKISIPKDVIVPTDEEGYLSLNLTKRTYKGIKIKISSKDKKPIEIQIEI